MNRTDIENEYQISERGTIQTPGKFEAEMLYVPFFYDAWGNGCASHAFSTVAFFEVLTDEVRMFPELDGCYGLALEETSQGFVACTTYDTREQYEHDLDAVAKAEAEVGE